jgi:signal recognition particle subunit SRP54
MASTLSDRLSRLVKTMRGQARITEGNVQDMLREVRMALLEADVALPVVSATSIGRVKERALGQEVVKRLAQPGPGAGWRRAAGTDRGDGQPEQRAEPQPVPAPAVILMAGLQGAGKTTTVGQARQAPARAQEEKVSWW